MAYRWRAIDTLEQLQVSWWRRIIHIQVFEKSVTHSELFFFYQYFRQFVVREAYWFVDGWYRLILLSWMQLWNTQSNPIQTIRKSVWPELMGGTASYLPERFPPWFWYIFPVKTSTINVRTYLRNCIRKYKKYLDHSTVQKSVLQWVGCELTPAATIHLSSAL